MKTAPRLVLAVIVGLCVGGGVMVYDKMRGAEWVVSPTEVAAAKAGGKAGVATRPGTVAVRPIRSETADVLPYKWGLFGIGAALGVFVMTRPRKPAA